MKRHRFYACLLTVMTLAGFTACSSTDNDGVTDGQTVNGKSQLTLTINTMGTRAAMTPDPTDEKTINRITVGIFDASGNVRTIQEFKSGDGTVGSNTFKTDNGSTKMNIVTNKLVAGDQVLVAVNAPSGLFHGAQTVSDFQSKSVDAGRALATNASNEETAQTDKEVADNAPMFGKADLQAPGENQTAYTADVNVSHLTAKISLTDIEVAFDPKASYQNATFSPTEIYVEHVVDGLNFNPEAGHWFDPSTRSLLTGATGVTDAKTYKTYLTTGTISKVTLSGAKDAPTAKMSTPYFFYVTPSSNNIPSGTDANAVRVWIKGDFDPDGSGEATATTVFYPVLLNVNYDAAGVASAADDKIDNKEVYKVYPNRNYTCKIIIKTKGLLGSGPDGKSQPEPGNDELKPQQATITVSVENWTPVEQTTTFE